VHTIATNAGVEGAVIVGKLLEQDNTDLGYDAAKGMVQSSSGIALLTMVV
jgi:chaperonin GroEL (HSP60 family)